MEISLALGGGGSRGHAHIGVIRRLEEEGFRIRAVAGTSAGGIVAACYAAGYTPDQLEAIFSSIDQHKLFGRSGRDGPAILGLAGAVQVLREHLGERTFADLKIPCAVTAVDVLSGREVVLKEGDVVEAVLATIAIPAIFPPRLQGDYQLVDGATLDPVPVSVARSLAPALPVIAVALTPRPGEPSDLLPLRAPVPVLAPLMEGLGRLRLAQALNIYIRATDATSRMLTDLRLRIESPDVIIRPAVGGIGILETVDVHHVVRLGEKAVDAALSDLRRSLSWPRRLRRRLFPRSC